MDRLLRYSGVEVSEETDRGSLWAIQEHVSA